MTIAYYTLHTPVHYNCCVKEKIYFKIILILIFNVTLIIFLYLYFYNINDNIKLIF